MKKNIFYLLCILTALQLTTSCKKDFLDTKSSTDVITSSVFVNLASTQTALDGIYRNMYEYMATDLNNASYEYGGSYHSDFGQKAYDVVLDLMGNDMVVNKQGYSWFNSDYQYTARSRTSDQGRPHNIWRFYYILINNANGILDNIDKVPGDAATRDAIKGQALAIRAHSYYYLINFFQQTYKGNEDKPGVPLYTSVPIIPSGAKGRGTVKQVYTQIVLDLKAADSLLTTSGYTQDGEKSHIDAHIVEGMMARVALQMEDYPNAALYAKKARQPYNPMSTADYATGFNSYENAEWMWGMHIIPDQATGYASFFSHFDATAFDYAQLGGQKKITKDLYDKMNDNDIRKSLFTPPGNGSTNTPDYCQLKFAFASASSFTGDYVFMRAAEMYLIEAEAKARTGDDGGARSVLEELVNARYAPNTYSAASFSGQALVDEVLLQRRIELWGEGFSWFDIKRLKTGLNRPTGDGNHGTPNFDPKLFSFGDGDPRLAFLIPQKEFDTNPKFTAADQNP